MTESEKTVRGELLRAMAVMAEVWPRKFCTAEAIRKAPLYERSIAKADPEVYVRAAEEWIDKNKWEPTPSEFAAYVWRLHRELHPEDSANISAHYAEQSGNPELAAERERLAKIQHRLDARALYIIKHCTSGKLEELSEIWATLWGMCTTDEERTAVRTGMVTKATINEAIKRHREKKQTAAAWREKLTTEEG